MILPPLVRSVVTAAVIVFSVTGAAAAEPLPAFTVEFQRPDVCVLVPSTTTTGQLKALVFALRESRQAGMLRERFGIAPTTPGLGGRPYAGVSVYIFSEPKWCRPTDFKAGIWAQGGSALDEAFTLAIRATYTYGIRPGQSDLEEGIIGSSYVDRKSKRVYTKPYEKLF